MKLEIAFEKFIKECEQGLTTDKRRISTIANYKNTMNLLRKWFPVQNVKDINRRLIIKFIKKGELDRKWKARTVISHCKNLRPFLKWCKSNKLIKLDPFKDIIMPRPDQSNPEIYNKEEIEKIIYAIQNKSFNDFLEIRDKAIIGVLVMTGIRKGELINLKVQDADFVNLRLLIKAENSKSHRERPVMLKGELVSLLRAYCQKREEVNPETDYLWISSTTKKRLTKSGLKKRFEDLSKLSGIRVRAHKFRHTFATETVEASQDIVGVSKILGHKDITTTMMYTHIKPESTRLTIETNPLGDLF